MRVQPPFAIRETAPRRILLFIKERKSTSHARVLIEFSVIFVISHRFFSSSYLCLDFIEPNVFCTRVSIEDQRMYTNSIFLVTRIVVGTWSLQNS